MAIKLYHNNKPAERDKNREGWEGNFGSAIEESAITVLCTAEHVIIQCEISRAW